MFVCGQGAPKRILPIYFIASPPTPLQGERGVKCKAKEHYIGDDRGNSIIFYLQFSIFNLQSSIFNLNCEL